MQVITNLPGVFPEILDRNLDIINSLPSPVVLVIGTAGSGPSEYLSPLRRSEDVRSVFGYEGTLGKGLLEAQTAANGRGTIVAYRIGATPARLGRIGGNPGIVVETLTKDSNAGETVTISWDNTNGIINIYDVASTQLIFSNDPSTTVDLGLVRVSGSPDGNTGGCLVSFSSANMPTLSAAHDTLPDDRLGYTAGTDGTSLTYQELYEKLSDAYRDLETAPVDIVVPKGAFLDVPNRSNCLLTLPRSSIISFGRISDLERF